LYYSFYLLVLVVVVFCVYMCWCCVYTRIKIYIYIANLICRTEPQQKDLWRKLKTKNRDAQKKRTSHEAVESVLRPEGSLWWERFVKKVGLCHGFMCNYCIQRAAIPACNNCRLPNVLENIHEAKCCSQWQRLVESRDVVLLLPLEQGTHP